MSVELPEWQAVDGPVDECDRCGTVAPVGAYDATRSLCGACAGREPEGDEPSLAELIEQGEALLDDEPEVDREQVAYDRGFTDGFAAGLAARPPAHVWVEVPATWAQVAPRDAFVGHDESLWHVKAIARYVDEHGRELLGGTFVNGLDEYAVPDLRPDEPVRLVVRAAERDAIDTLATHLGGHVLARTDQAA